MPSRTRSGLTKIRTRNPERTNHPESSRVNLPSWRKSLFVMVELPLTGGVPIAEMRGENDDETQKLREMEAEA